MECKNKAKHVIWKWKLASVGTGTYFLLCLPIITIPICRMQEFTNFFEIFTIMLSKKYILIGSSEVIFLVPNCGNCKNTTIWNTLLIDTALNSLSVNY